MVAHGSLFVNRGGIDCSITHSGLLYEADVNYTLSGESHGGAGTGGHTSSQQHSRNGDESGRVSPQSPASPLPGAAAGSPDFIRFPPPCSVSESVGALTYLFSGSMVPGADYEMQGIRYQAGARSQELVATSVGAAAAMDAHRGMQESKVSPHVM